MDWLAPPGGSFRTVLGLLLVPLLASPGCTTRSVRTDTQRLTIESQPPGTTLQRLDGERLGTTPLTLEETYSVEVEQPNHLGWLGVAAAAGLWAGSVYLIAETEQMGMGIAGLSLLTGPIVAAFVSQLQVERRGVRENPATREVRLVAQLQGYETQELRVQVPASPPRVLLPMQPLPPPRPVAPVASRQGEVTVPVPTPDAAASRVPVAFAGTAEVSSGTGGLLTTGGGGFGSGGLGTTARIRRRGARPVVAVFDMRDRRGLLDTEQLSQLTSYLVTRLTESAGFRVVPLVDVRRRVEEAKRRGQGDRFDPASQVALGRALAAEKAMGVEVLRVGRRCMLSATLWDLVAETSEAAASVESGCSPEELLQGLSRLAERI
ncbi:MAG: hypothetical protein RBU45_14290 [Myxococcota bacterium]|nr:hypothetical protein [Myxococcota bacterium]